MHTTVRPEERPGREPCPPLLSLVVPCYNEAHRLQGTFQGIRTLASALPFPIEVVVVDDGSDDATSAMAARLGRNLPDFRLLSEPHRGKGGALRAGVLVARGEYVFLADADWSMPAEQVLAFLPPALTDFDVAIGSRVAQGAKRYGEPVSRHLIGRVFNRMVQTAVLPGVRDSQCGFKCLRREPAVELFRAVRIDGWAYDVEVLVLARRRGLRIREIPIDWYYRADSRVRPGRDSLAMFRDLVRITLRHRVLGPLADELRGPGERSSAPQASSDCPRES